MDDEEEEPRRASQVLPNGNPDLEWRSKSSVLQTLKDKPNEEDLSYEAQESEQYHNQPLSSRSEILSWYVYDWANSPMFNVVTGLTIPIFLTRLATQYGCENNTKYGCDYESNAINSNAHITVSMGSAWHMKPASYTFAIIAFSGLLQAFCYITIGALADYAYYQYYLFRICAITASSMLLVFFFLDDPSQYLFAGWWIALELVTFGLALIFYNAYLPQIVENHWIVRKKTRDKIDAMEIALTKQQLTDDMSQYGYAFGYSGSLVMTIVTVILFGVMTETTYEIYKDCGLTSSAETHANDELWLKRVNMIDMMFENDNLIGIQLYYDHMTIDGELFGSNNTNTNNSMQYTYEIADKNGYITEIEFWYNSDDDDSINSMRFTNEMGTKSRIYNGYSNDSNITNNLGKSDETAKGSDDNFIFAGYEVYKSKNIGVIAGLDVLFLNNETGQFESTLPMRLVCLLCFFWWNLFQLITFKFSKRRDGPPLPENASPLTFSSIQFYETVKTAKRFPDMFRYLLAWFCFSDGLGTLSTAAVLFATEEMNMTSGEAATLVLIALFIGSFGGILFLKIQRYFGWSAKKMLLVHIWQYIGMSCYVMIGLIPNAPFGVVNKWELYLYVAVFGLNWGSIQSYARSVFANIVPVNMESQLFALYEITDKGSSWIGPLMVAFVSNYSNIRVAIVYVVIFFIAAVPLLIWGVDMKRGMRAAGRWKDSEMDIDTNGVGRTNDNDGNDDDGVGFVEKNPSEEVLKENIDDNETEMVEVKDDTAKSVVPMALIEAEIDALTKSDENEQQHIADKEAVSQFSDED